LETTGRNLLNQVKDLFALALERSPDLEQMLETFHLFDLQQANDALEDQEPVPFLAAWNRLNPSLPPKRVAQIAEQPDQEISLQDLRLVFQATLKLLDPEE
jgi:hypothetical protein